MNHEGHSELDGSREAAPDALGGLDDLMRRGPAECAEASAPPDAVPIARPIILPADTCLCVPGLARGGVVPAIGYAAAGSPWYPQMSLLRAVGELLLLLTILVGGAVGGYILGSSAEPGDDRWQGMAANLGMGLMGLIAVPAMLLWARQPGASIGWTSRRLGLNALVGLGSLILFYVVLYSGLLAACLAFPELLDGTNTAQKAIEQAVPPLPMAQMMLLMIVTVLWEEVVFRGFLLTRLRAIFNTWWLAIPFASLLFAVAHFYQGALAVVVIAWLALLMSLLFVWRRSLVPCLVLHWLHNVGTILLLKDISTTWQ